jgi:hypothetical protein
VGLTEVLTGQAAGIGGIAWGKTSICVQAATGRVYLVEEYRLRLPHTL